MRLPNKATTGPKEQPRAKSMGNPLHTTGSNHVSVNRRFNGLMHQLTFRIKFKVSGKFTYRAGEGPRQRPLGTVPIVLRFNAGRTLFEAAAFL